jgi:hypothetical protein
MTIAQAVSVIKSSFNIGLLPHVVTILITISPVILAVILFVIMWELWVQYVRQDFFSEMKLKHTVLELRLPQETNKSPLAMETILQSIHNTSDTSFYSQYWKGEKRPWYSLELVSLGGQVKFMIWTEDRRKSGLMASLYSQFPGIEIYERDDYARSVHFDPKTMRIWAAEFKLNKDDPYPLKTYIDFGLDKDPKEEFKVDPLGNVIEYLGTVPPDSQIWFQIIVTAHVDQRTGHIVAFKKEDAFKKKSQKIIDDILVRNKLVGKKYGEEGGEITKEHKVAGGLMNDGFIAGPAITEGEKEATKAIERKSTKLLFDVGIRALYICPKDKFDGPFGIGGCISSMRQFNTEGYNGWKPNGDKWHAQFSGYPWEDYRNMRRNRQSRLALMAYKRRSFFYPPFQGTPSVLNTEELATMYHFPGSTASTPNLERVPSKKASAPANLPI